MNRNLLWAPWRETYLTGVRQKKVSGCLFCWKARQKKNSKELILLKGRLSFCLLNRFPYAGGHLLIAPTRHVGMLEDLTREEWNEMGDLVRESLRRLRRALKPDGFNLGINLGRSAGAGIPGHLHLHIVPRWSGDVNFMPVAAHTKVISQSLDSAWRLLKRAGEPDGPKKSPRKGH